MLLFTSLNSILQSKFNQHLSKEIYSCENKENTSIYILAMVSKGTIGWMAWEISSFKKSGMINKFSMELSDVILSSPMLDGLGYSLWLICSREYTRASKWNIRIDSDECEALQSVLLQLWDDTHTEKKAVTKKREKLGGFALGQQMEKKEEKPKSTQTMVCKMDHRNRHERKRQREECQRKIK